VQSTEQSGRALARRLRMLRTDHWPGTKVRQQQLAEAFGTDKPLSESLISSWESAKAVPPVHRLQAYATFFATQRSIETDPAQLLDDRELTTEERTRRDALLEELMQLREGEQGVDETDAHRLPLARSRDTIGGGSWYFPDERPVTIVCGLLPEKLRNQMPYARPEDPDYIGLHGFADLDALLELFGHLRAVNPTITVNYRSPDALRNDDFTTHLVLLGGVDINPVVRDILRRQKVPVRQRARGDDDPYDGYFETGEGAQRQEFVPVLDRTDDLVKLREDVCHFYRGANPYNIKRTLTICNGMFGRGTYGAVRALTDVRFRDRNEAYLAKRFAAQPAFSILSRVLIVNGAAVTPDWTEPDNRLHEWPEPGA
jgi:transcriptional regulator with XRE-family HTH domain